jgi:hypothetical protein
MDDDLRVLASICGCRPRHLRRAHVHATHLDFRSGDTISSRGATGRQVVVVWAGIVVVRSPDGFAVASPGTVLDVMQTPTDGLGSSSWHALGDCTVMVLDQAAWRSLCLVAPELANHLVASSAPVLLDPPSGPARPEHLGNDQELAPVALDGTRRA